MTLPPADDLPGDASSARWKRFVSTGIAVVPLLLAVSSPMRWLLKGANGALRKA